MKYTSKCLSRWRTACVPIYADDYTLLAVVRKLEDRPAVAVFLKRTWLGFKTNHNNTKTSVVSRSRTVNPPHGDFVFSVVSIRASPNLNILDVKFDSKLTFENHVRGIVSLVSQKISILRLVKRIFVDTSVLLRCYYAFVLPILEYIVLRCRGRLLNVTFSFFELKVYLVARLCPDQVFLSLCHRRHVVWLCRLNKINWNSGHHCLFFELPSASTRVLQSSSGRSSSIGVSGINVLNVKIYEVFPDGPGSNVDWPSLHCVWHRNAGFF